MMRWIATHLSLGLFILFSSIGFTMAQENEPVPLVSEGEYDLLNFLLLGSDTANSNNSGRTDAIMIVSVNQNVGAVSFLSIPRDLYVYIPDVGMNKINTVYAYGENNTEEGGAELLKATIRHNLGIEIDHYARVNFSDFKRIIDDLGGVEVTADCAIQDWCIKWTAI
jgi:anionic cell wall polymer biosynthesis LytR-Cps2A-Psr (LCP) family protein